MPVAKQLPGGAIQCLLILPQKLLNLEGIIVRNISHSDSYVKIFFETKPTSQRCPCCNNETHQIHDYRYQQVKDLPLQFKYCYLILIKRRYRCKCDKRFPEKYSFLASYQQRSVRLTKYIANELRNMVSIKSIAEKANVSSTTVTRILDTIHYDSLSLKKYHSY